VIISDLRKGKPKAIFIFGFAIRFDVNKERKQLNSFARLNYKQGNGV
jgi:hypothetical protein